jgi:hypothetical protein
MHLQREYEVPIVQQGHDIGTIEIKVNVSVLLELEFRIDEIWVRDINSWEHFKASGPFFSELKAWVETHKIDDLTEQAMEEAA